MRNGQFHHQHGECLSGQRKSILGHGPTHRRRPKVPPKQKKEVLWKRNMYHLRHLRSVLGGPEGHPPLYFKSLLIALVSPSRQSPIPVNPGSAIHQRRNASAKSNKFSLFFFRILCGLHHGRPWIPALQHNNSQRHKARKSCVWQ